MVISVPPAPDNVQLVPLRRSKISVDTVLEKCRAENRLARHVRRPEQREMTAAPSKHHTDVNSVMYLCAAMCVVIDLVLSSGILRNLLTLNENCSIYSILYFLCIHAFANFQTKQTYYEGGTKKCAKHSKIITCDHTFKVSKYIGARRGGDNNFVQQFHNLFTVLYDKR